PAGWQNSAVTVTLSPTDAGSGVSTTRYSVDGGSWNTGTSVNVPAADGAHTIAYYSVDAAGNIESQKSATVLVQASGPSCPTCTAADYLRDVVSLNAAPTTTGAPITSVEFLYDATSIGVDTTSPYSTSWDTTAVPDGTYDLNVVVTDAATNVSTIDLGNKVVDNTLPSAAVGAPLAGTLVTGSVSFSASASDAHLASVDYYVNGTQIGSTSGAAVTWDTTSVADGSATLYVVATDRSGNSRTSSNVFVTVDNLAPTISLNAPADASGTVTLTASASADTTSVEFQRRSGAGPWTPMVTDNSAPFQASFDTTTVTDGTYDLRAIATDGAGHTTTTAAQQIVIDNTLPTGSLATPLPGATVGGTVSFTANATDATSGVATVAYEVRTTGSVPFTAAGSASSAPWTVAWPTAGLTTGSYDVRLVITDRSGNVFSTAPVTISVDATPPGVQLQSLPATVTGSITLHATTSGQGATRVVFGVSPAGSGRWVDLGTATAAPWSASLDTTTVPDGSYDFRATVFDSVGNSATSVQTNVVVDNSAPTLVSSTPADGATVESLTSFQLVASETLGSIASPLIDGNAAPAPVISGATATFNLGALANGLHTLSGRLVDTVGKSTPFLLHVTIQPAGTPPDGQASVEKNAIRGQTTTLTTADGGITVRMPAASWPATGGDAGDWIVLRVDPSGPSANLGMAGFESLSPIYDVTARWALNGNHLHTGFGRELVLEIPDPTGKALPVTSDGSGSWRLIPPLPANANGRLPAAMEDAFYRDRGNIEILSRHLTPFALVRDVQAPTAPTDLAGTFDAGGLNVKWTPGVDNSNLLGPAIVYADGKPLETVTSGATTTSVGLATATDGRRFSIVQTDASGNASSQSKVLIVLPDLTGMTVEQARATLLQRGFTIGSVTATSGTNVQPGLLVSPTGRSAAVEGDPINLVFSGTGAQTKLALSVVGTRSVKASKSGHVAVRINLSKVSAVTATLYSPRGKSLKVWHFTLHAGVSIRTLKLPASATTPGRYRLVWAARSGKEQLAKTITVEVVGAAKPAAKNQQVDIVLVGDSAIRNGLSVSLHSSNARVLTTAEENATFLLTGNPALNIQAVVVDVDSYTLSMVHDLRTVF
ncbi:MAG: large repetitive protein, partial [Gaiellaceae bacterium]|nr:large repetitive protein [Gaiellaceae bacterium]